MKAVFVDSGAFIAALDRGDGHHAEVRALFAEPPGALRTSILVFSETYGWLLHRLGEEAARRLGGLVGALPGLKLYEATADLHRATLRLLDRLRGTKLTYVDAASLALIERHRLTEVWGTDHHLGLTGARVVPGGS